ncbi:THUMP domain-containing protein 1 homolog [Dendroctonus ponderosae]
MSKVEKSYKKPHYGKGAPKRRGVEEKLKGFLCSCNIRERDCVRESYNLLNKYADLLWPPQAAASDANVEESLETELKSLRSEKRFQVVDSGAKNLIFIKTTLEEPVTLAEHILQQIYESKSQETRFLIRLVPIETTCKAYIKDIEQAFQPLCERHFSLESKTFAVMFNHRNNNSVTRDEVIKTVADIVAKHGESRQLDHKVDLKNAELAIVLEVIRGFVFIGVVPNYFKYKKYNLLTFAPSEEPATDQCPSANTEPVEN